MLHIQRWLAAALVSAGLAACSESAHREDLVRGSFQNAQAEVQQAVQSIAQDIVSQNIEGLQSAHLNSEKFTKFGPRSFDRQDLIATNESEAAFFSSITSVKYEVRDLKVDIFGSVAVATYYPQASFTKDGERRTINARQTFVFVKTVDGWKLAHEHGTLRP